MLQPPVPASQWEVPGGGARLGCHTIGDLAHAMRYVRSQVAADVQHPAGYGTYAGELADLQMLVDNLPPGWYDAAAAAVQSQPHLSALPTSHRTPTQEELAIEVKLLNRLGWVNWGTGHVSLSTLTVKAATHLQLGPVRTHRQQKFTEYVHEALGSQRQRALPGIGCIRKAQRKVWALRWDNHHKEILWRLPLDGLCTAARMHNAQDPCICGALMPGRAHHFYDCPVAAAVLQNISANLPNAWCSRQADGSAVLRKHLWLMQPPPGPRRLHHGVWHVVCVAALNAMDVGRKSANEFRMLQLQPQPAVPDPVVLGQPRITTLLQPAPLTAAQQQHNDMLEQQRLQQRQQEAARRLVEAKEQAVARFWLLLTDFAIMHAAPDTWIPHVAEDHPFLCREPMIDTLVVAPRLA